MASGEGLPHLPLPRVGEGCLPAACLRAPHRQAPAAQAGGEGDGLPEKIPSTQVRTTKDTEDTKTDRHGTLR